jgi:isopentenyl phosphate kinase
MTPFRYLSNKRLLLERAFVAWLTLLVSCVLFATVAALVSLVIQDQTLILLTALVIVAPMILVVLLRFEKRAYNVLQGQFKTKQQRGSEVLSEPTRSKTNNYTVIGATQREHPVEETESINEDISVISETPSETVSSLNLYFVKLSGSLITEKFETGTARLEVLERVANEISLAFAKTPDLQLVLGHGSGSFGMPPASRFKTKRGVSSATEWQGFAEVWFQTSSLNRLVVEALHIAGLPAISFPISAGAVAQNGAMSKWDYQLISEALKHGLLPVVYGDVVFDNVLGGTIISTEQIFRFMSQKVIPARVLLVSQEAGIYLDYPARTRRLEIITPENLDTALQSLTAAGGVFLSNEVVTDVNDALSLLRMMPSTEAIIISGEVEGMLSSALQGEYVGTTIRLKTK